MAIRHDALAIYLNQLLNCNAFSDYAPNGLQIEGRTEINTLCTAVTASAAVIDQAILLGADALLVHHGYFWRGEPPNIVGTKRRRIAALINHDINLFAYHLPLDCHSELGNNSGFAKSLRLTSVNSHPINKIPDLLWTGQLTQPMTVTELSRLLEEALQRPPQVIEVTSEKKLRSIAFCTGAAQDYIEEAHQLGVDAYLSGEISERTYHQAHELGLTYFACGHHAMERFGVQELGSELAKAFSLKHHFIDSDNPI